MEARVHHLFCMQMRKILLASVLAAGVCAASADSENVTLSNGVQVTIHTTLGKPTGTTSVAVEMERASGDSFYRIFRDQNHLAVFAYELEVARSGTAGFRLTTKPVEDEFAKRFPDADGGKPVPTFSAAKDYPLDNGEPATISVYELEGQGLAVVDTVQMALHSDSSGSSGGLRFSGLSISVNGVPSKTVPGSSVSGRYAMFYIPGQGGFFFSSDSVSGRQFIKAGYVDGNQDAVHPGQSHLRVHRPIAYRCAVSGIVGLSRSRLPAGGQLDAAGPGCGNQ